MPSARTIITIAVVSSLTFLAFEHLKARNPATASRIGLNTL